MEKPLKSLSVITLLKKLAGFFFQNPNLYQFFQNVVRARDPWQDLLANELPWLKPETNVLDIGCGPGSLLRERSVPTYPQNFTGIDVSEQYIVAARRAFPGATFHVGTTDDVDVEPGTFDLAIMSGVCHHLDDTQMVAALQFALRALRQGGALVTIDPVIFVGQNPLAWFLGAIDRGNHVRTPGKYAELWQKAWAPNSFGYRIEDSFLRVPYSHAIFLGTKN